MKLYEVNSLEKYNFSCIYLWTNLINDKKYVGQAQSFYRRMADYRYGKFNKYMKNAIEKYGIDNFDITILEQDVELDMLDEREQYWLDYYRSYDMDKGYNICQYASTTRGYRHSKESKQKMSDSTKEKLKDPLIKAKVQGKNNGMYGKKHTNEWRKNHSGWLKNRWQTDESYRLFWSKKMSGANNYFYNKHFVGDKNPRARKVRCVELNAIYTTIKEASEAVGTSRQNISHALNGRQETAHNYHWEYVDS